MARRLHAFAIALALALVGPAAGSAVAQERGGSLKGDYPKLRAALHELREARNTLKAARDNWPPGHRDRALRHIDDAIKSVRTILDVKNIDDFRGVDRRPDYYKRYSDHPRLRAALDDLRDARVELRAARSDFRGLKQRALDDIDVAVGEILTLIRHNPRR